MEHHTIALADAYATHWLHRIPENVYVRSFMTVESAARPEEFMAPGSVKFKAELSLGWHDATVPNFEQLFARFPPGFPIENISTDMSGFTASFREVDGTELGGMARSIFSRAYPMDNIPIRRIRNTHPEA
jgi:hypothetical protein